MTRHNQDYYKRPTSNDNNQSGNAPRGNTRPTSNETRDKRLNSTSNGNHYGPCTVNNNPAWMQDQSMPAPQVVQTSKKPTLMVYSAQIYSATA